jgi:hypothetical protein
VSYLGAAQLSVEVPSALLTGAGDFPLVVSNPAPGGGVSMPLIFRTRYALPNIGSLSAYVVASGSPQTVVSIFGAGFAPVSQVTLNYAAAYSTFVSPSQLDATLTVAQLSSAGVFGVRVVNPNPGGGTSNAVDFRVDSAAATLTSVAPSTPIFVGASDTLFTLVGTGFGAPSQVRVNGANLLTTLASATKLTATVPASAFASAGTLSFVVANPGASVSNTVTLAVDCSGSGVDVQLNALNMPTSLPTNFRLPASPKTPRFAAAGACPMPLDTTTNEPYRAVIVQNASKTPATLAAWAVCRTADDALLTFYRRATIPKGFEREVCSPVVAEGKTGAGAYDSPEANSSVWCPGLTKANGGGIALGVCERAVVYLQPYSASSTAPLSLKVSLQ